MAGAALQNIAFNRMGLNVVQRAVEVLSEDSLTLKRVRVSVSTVVVSDMAAMDCAMRCTDTHVGVAERQVRHRLLTVVTAVMAIELFTLKFVLDTLAVRSVADKRKNRADALNEQGTLAGLSVVKCSLQNPRSIHPAPPEKSHHGRTYLHTVIAIGISQQFLQAGSVQELSNEHLARAMLGDADALYMGTRL